MQWSRSQVHIDFLGSYVGFIMVVRICLILSSCPHPFLPRCLVPPPVRLLSVHFQSPWRSGCSPSSISCDGSETRFWSAAPLNKAHWRFRCVCVWSGSGWSETPSPAQVFGSESISDVLCACLSRSPLLLGYKVTNLIPFHPPQGKLTFDISACVLLASDKKPHLSTSYASLL